jgi:hypothetical protein
MREHVRQLARTSMPPLRLSKLSVGTDKPMPQPKQLAPWLEWLTKAVFKPRPLSTRLREH